MSFGALHVARTGLDAQGFRMQVIANNLANVNTTGFKRDRANFETLGYQMMTQPGAPSSSENRYATGLNLGTGVELGGTARIDTQGSLNATGNALDMAIEGAGFFQVLLPDGSTAYTRDGSFQLDSQGQLVTSSGFVVQPAITIPANATSVTIARDGTVSVTQQGSATPTQVGALQLATFLNPAGLESKGENLYVETAASGTPSTTTPGTNGSGLLLQGYAETSNVNVVEEMVNMIQTQRAYEINSKAISTSDQMLQRLTQL